MRRVTKPPTCQGPKVLLSREALTLQTVGEELTGGAVEVEEVKEGVKMEMKMKRRKEKRKELVAIQEVEAEGEDEASSEDIVLDM